VTKGKEDFFEDDIFWLIFAPSRNGKSQMINAIVSDSKFGVFKRVEPSEFYIISTTVIINPKTGKNDILDESL
jgi:hypothetical protein